MNEEEITRLMKSLMKIFQDFPVSEFDEGEMEERMEEIKRELGPWFIDSSQLYQAS